MNLRATVPLLLALLYVPPSLAANRSGKTYDFPIYTNKPPGKQITSNQLPATTPALSPEETQKKIQVPPGFEVRLFAAEPEVVNPVAMTWDERGRLWVLELYEYPKGAPKGEKGRDRIKILEDVDADGRADTVKVFADGYSLATGLALGNGGVYLGVAPDLLFLEDTNGDDKADKTTVLKTGFGMEDRHELLNGFAWGPDGWLYMTHGVFTHSKVRDPNAHDPDGFGVQMDAALARYHPRTKKFEVFADGTSNPWGVDWNERGDAFVSACVIQHLFHMAPGGQYNRQGGTWANPYGYVGDLPSNGLPAIVDWRHYRAAHSGICVYQGDQWPAEWRGLVFLGNIHQSALNCDRLTPVGSTYRAEKESTLLGPAGQALLAKSGEKIPEGEEWKFVGPGNFLVSKDPWFRPVSAQTGPDGAMWVMDWYDKYPCYQNAQADPEGVDREYGRIWRIVWVGDQPGKAVASRPEKAMDLKKLSGDQLINLFAHPNSWQQRQGRRLLTEMVERSLGRYEEGLLSSNWVESVEVLLRPSYPLSARLGGLWTLRSTGSIRQQSVSFLSGDRDPAIRQWIARMSLDQPSMFASISTRSQSWFRWFVRDEAQFSQLVRLASDPAPSVRAGVAVALRQLTASTPTANGPSRYAERGIGNVLLPLFNELLARPSVDGDFYYPHIVWMAMEPLVAKDPQPFFPIVSANENSVSAYCVRRVMRRICDLTDAAPREKHLNAAMEFLGSIAPKTTLAEAALDGLIDAFKSKGAPPSVPLGPVFEKLNANPALADKARRLATLLGDTGASRALIAKINDLKASVDDRLKGIQAARETKDEASKAELLKFLKSPLTLPSPPVGERVLEGRVRGPSDQTQQLYAESVRALSAFDSDEIAYAIVDAWKSFTLPTRRVAADVLVTRNKWSRAVLAGVDRKVVGPEDFSATARRTLARSSDGTVVDHANRVLGRYRAPGEDKLKLIAEKRKVVLSGEPDTKAGYEVAKRVCFVCHKLYGEGADVGPDLTGVGRSTLDALLHNIIDPNEVIGNGFENTEVELKDGRTLNGRIVEDSPTRLKLLASGPIEHIVAKSDIAVANGKPAIRTSVLSLMPDALEQIPDKDFRDLIWYLLNPPGDNRPWTPALRKELLGN